MPTYDGTYKLAVEDGRVLIRDVEGGSQSTHVPLEIYSNYAAQGTLTDSRQLRLRTQPYLESNTANAYVTDMGIESKTDNYFFITAPQKTSNVGDQNTFVISSTSNIGIGTTDPTKPLHVVGDTWITGTLTTSNIVGASPVTISSDIVMAAGATLTTSNIVANTGDTFLVSSNLEVGTSNLFVDTTTGNVGINTTSPADLLDVKNGTVRSSDSGNTTNVPGLKIRKRPAASGQSGSNYIECGEFADVGNDGSGTDGNRFIVKNDGNVGIGTPSPWSGLHLNKQVALTYVATLCGGAAFNSWNTGIINLNTTNRVILLIIFTPGSGEFISAIVTMSQAYPPTPTWTTLRNTTNASLYYRYDNCGSPYLGFRNGSTTQTPYMCAIVLH